MKKFVASLIVILILTASAYLIVLAWGFNSHYYINGKAVIHLPSSMNSFKSDSAYFVAHAADADIRRNSADTSFYAEQWRHYFDIDDYPDFYALPRNLDSVIMLYGYERVKRNGINPWVTAWYVDSLTNQLARQDMAAARQTASDIGHYVADAHNPLHVTVNYNGQLTGNTGIHSRYETTMINMFISQITTQKDSVQYIVSPIDYIFEYIFHSNSLVDSVLAADNYAKAVSGWSGSGSAPQSYYDALWDKTKRFTIDQFQRATVAVASLWYTAWVNAGLLPLMVQPSSLNLGTVLVEQSSTDSVIFKNTQPFTLTISLAVTDNERFALHPASAVIPPFGNQTFYVVFTPIDSSYQRGNAIFTHNGPQSPTIVSISGKGEYYYVELDLQSRWNIVSVPVKVTDSATVKLFPNSISSAYSFNGTYHKQDTLRTGIGYWLKFSPPTTNSIGGYPLRNDTLNLNEGWNLIGSLTYPISTSDIIPLGVIIQSQVFGYANGYYPTDTIQPGKGYWIKVSNKGKIVLRSDKQ